MTASGGTAAQRATPSAVTVTIACALIYCLDGLVHSIMGPLAPFFAPDLRLDNAAVGPIFSANLIGQCIGLVLFPPIAERYGDRLTVTLTLAGFGVAQTASGLVDTGTGLFWARLVTGLFLGGCLPSCLTMVTAVAPERRRGVAITALFTGYGLGAAIAGIAAIGFVELGGWRTAMVAIGALCIASVVVAARCLRDVPEPASSTLPDSKLTPLTLLAAPYRLGTLMLWLIFIAMLTISYCLSSWLPLLLVRIGYDSEFAAVALSIFSFGGIAAALSVGLLVDRFGAVRVLVCFMLMSALLFVVTGLTIGLASAAMLQLLLAMSGFFALGAYGGVNIVLAGFYPGRLRSTGIGWAKSVGRIGTVAAPVAIGLGLDAGISEAAILSAFAVPALIAATALTVMAVSNRQAPARGGRRTDAAGELT